MFLILWSCLLQGQGIRIKGKVTDASTHKPLAFVNIITPDGKYGTTTDIEGKFSLTLTKKVCCLRVSYVGYESAIYPVDYNTKDQNITLHPETVNIGEVKVFPGINPAYRIIHLAIANREKNDPEKLKKFSYTSYDKMIFTIDADSLMTMDTALLDSSERKFRRFLEKQDLFMMETVTRRLYIRPSLNQEKVLATKVSGFRDPVVIFMISRLQSTSFYRNKINILTKSYINPISAGSIKKYLFLLEDTIIRSPGDTTYIISYRPRRNTKFDGLKGFLSINSRGWAIQNVKAGPAKDTSGILVNIQQAYTRIDSTWFPVQLNTDIIFRNANFEYKGKTYNLVAHGISFLRDINLHPDIKKRDIGLQEVEIEPDAVHKKNDFWQTYRETPLTDKEKETYRIIDSLGKAENFDRYANIIQTLMTGSIPAGPLDLEMDQFLRYNDYEGIYLGLGLHTNRRFSKVITLGGFYGYGFRDKKSKYGADLLLNIHKPSESVLRFDYYYKALPGGGISFPEDSHDQLNVNNYSQFFTKRMNMTEGMEAHYSFRTKLLRDFRWHFGLVRQSKTAFGNYMYAPFSTTDTTQTYGLTLATAGFRFAFREKALETTKGPVSLGSDYPVIDFKFSHGFGNLLHGDFSLNRFDIRISDVIKTNYYGDMIWSVHGGIVNGNTPATELFAANGTYRPFVLYTPGAFGTMRTNEFLSDRYTSVFLTWDFRDLLIQIKKWKPRLLLVTNFTIGNLSHPEYHINYNFKTLTKGYYESGIMIRKLLSLQFTDLGLGVMYRYGPYHLPATKDNFAYKFSIYYSF